MKEIHQEVEKWLLSQWETLLNLTNIDPNDHFVELGGNSILALRLANQLNKKLGVTIPPVILLTVDTVASQVEALIDNFRQEVEEAFNPGDRSEDSVSDQNVLPGQENSIPTAADPFLKELDQLPDEEIERLLSDDSTDGRDDS